MTAEEVPVSPAAAMKKKTKKVLKTVSPEHVAFVLAKKPTPPVRPSPRMQSILQVSDKSRRESARVNELIMSNHELLRSIQDKYRHDLATKGFVQVEVQVEVSDDDF